RPLIDALNENGPTAQEAARALAKIGPDAKDAVPVLKPLLTAKDAKLAQEAAEALAKIGKSSITALTEAVKSDDGKARQLAVTALGKIGADAVAVLVDALADKRVDVRRQAAQVLGPLRVSDKMVVLALAHAVKDEDQTVRQNAVRALQMLGAGGKPA